MPYIEYYNPPINEEILGTMLPHILSNALLMIATKYGWIPKSVVRLKYHITLETYILEVNNAFHTNTYVS